MKTKICYNDDCGLSVPHYHDIGKKSNKQRLEEIRKAIKDENISYGEIAELQGLTKYIDKNDAELLQWAGVCEHCGGINCKCEI